MVVNYGIRGLQFCESAMGPGPSATQPDFCPIGCPWPFMAQSIPFCGCIGIHISSNGHKRTSMKRVNESFAWPIISNHNIFLDIRFEPRDHRSIWNLILSIATVEKLVCSDRVTLLPAMVRPFDTRNVIPSQIR